MSVLAILFFDYIPENMSTNKKLSLNHDHERKRARWKVNWGVPARAAGGTARAAALSGDERREIARKAAKARWARHLPQATHEGALRFGAIEIEVAVLDNGQRVITQSGFMAGLGRIRPPKGRQYYRSGANLPAFLTVQSLKPFIGEDLVAMANQIEFRTKHGIKAFGYSPNFLREVCDVFARAQHAGVLTATQHNIANRAQIVAEQFERSCTTRLIDEATSYQEIRETQMRQGIYRREE
ncbi:hypothetical protein [Bradyrhizobium sp. NC92]|uniref:hypothetical protein n=1 Tax=Bradyrhizobium sp. (strain NC92) TaxID=55395 RepID=UPI0021AA6CDD|nr:hypothetical protein [Bradyrhizobium sp. NC92]UWU66980.1 hypothetical protein N2602_27540 [Bradyrhizobium sp. NC92]